MKTASFALVFSTIALLSTGLAAQEDKRPIPSVGTSPLTAVPASGEKLQQLGTQSVDDKTAGDVREILAQIVNDALTDNKFPSLVQHLAKPDRDRIGDMDGEKFDDLRKAIADFRAEFKARYHKDFDIKPEDFKEATINQGQDKSLLTVTLSGRQRITAEGASATPPAVLPGVIVAPAPHTGATGGVTSGDPALSVVSGPTINFINEGRTARTVEPALWKVNIPNEITGRQLKGNLTKHLQKLADQKSTWSDDPNATTRAAASQVFQALNDSSLASEE